ncbi:MAG: alcohol dehydrogenase catalytic domain-containing protein [Alphaproteobacteria bacterium]|nr:alcohol dehydrogenase catalytic domain-containing protein [Alphaproteobacteria bacterium]
MRCQAMTAFGQPLEDLERETPQPGPGEALVKITRAGLCHSDLHIHEGFFNVGGDAKQPVAVQFPCVLGHEIEGEVAALGDGAKGPAPGTRVAVFPWIGCGQCTACKRGDQHLCGPNRVLGVARWGGLADHVLVPDADALIPIGDLAPGVGALAMCSGLTAFSALKKIGKPRAEEPIVLVGMGGVGLAGLALAKALFPNPIVAVDIDPAKREAALKRGAAEAIDPAAADAAKTFVKQSGGAVAAVDFVGAGDTYAFASGSIRRGGTVVVVGLFGGLANIPLITLPLRAMTIAGSFVGSLDEARELVDLLKTGKVATPLMEERPLAAANSAFDDLRAGKVVGRVVLTP